MDRNDAVLVLVDVQDCFSGVVHESSYLIERLLILVQGLQLLGVPVVVTEQVPEKLGETVEALQSVLTDYHPISKSSFSCFGSDEFRAQLDAIGAKSVIVAGVEAHVCIYQTVRDLLAAGYTVQVPHDGVTSQRVADRDWALQAMQNLGANVTGVEMLVTDLLEDAADPLFRSILGLLK